MEKLINIRTAMFGVLKMEKWQNLWLLWLKFVDKTCLSVSPERKFALTHL